MKVSENIAPDTSSGVDVSARCSTLVGPFGATLFASFEPTDIREEVQDMTGRRAAWHWSRERLDVNADGR